MVLLGFGTLLLAVVVMSGLHIVTEGNVGLYWRGGALLNTMTEPGWHVKLPALTRFAEVQVSIQTDIVREVPCGTSGGVVIYFDRIEVVNRLRKSYAIDTVRKYSELYDKIWIDDKIHHLLNQFCSLHTLEEVYITKFDSLDEMLQLELQKGCSERAPGIEIISTRVTKPRVPASVMANYEQVETERTKLLIANEARKVIETEAQTEQLMAKIAAQTEADVNNITMERSLLESITQKAIQEVEDQIHVELEYAKSNAAYHRISTEASANALRFTPRYLDLQLSEVFANTTKLIFSSTLAKVFE